MVTWPLAAKRHPFVTITVGTFLKVEPTHTMKSLKRPLYEISRKILVTRPDPGRLENVCLCGVFCFCLFVNLLVFEMIFVLDSNKRRVLYDVTAGKQVTWPWTAWNSQTEKQKTTLKLWRFVWEREIWPKVVSYMKWLLERDSQTQKQEATLKLWGFVWERGIWPKVVFYMK